MWQTPVRHDQRTGTSHASANSRRLVNFGFQGTLSPLRAKETCGPDPARPSGGCGKAEDDSAMPGVMALAAPKISSCTWLRETPNAASPEATSFKNAVGPHR